MPTENTVLDVEDPHFTIRLYEDLLKIDLKGSFKNEIEEAIENKPVLKEQSAEYLASLFHCTYSIPNIFLP